MEREKFSSRLGFILISAGCAIGLGNVWRFPYIVGQYGGAIFVLIYLVFLAVLGLPVIVMEFSVGRASQRSEVKAFEMLEPKGTKWHLHKYIGIVGNYLLMLYYTTIAGWLVLYFFKEIKGDFEGQSAEAIGGQFSAILGQPWLMFAFTAVTVVGCFLICSGGLQNGVEKITKVMMLLLIVLMIVLAVNSVFFTDSAKGLEFYLLPNPANIRKVGLANVINAALSQSFFTLSIGIGSMEIFGSYIGREKRLLGEGINVVFLDTLVAIMAGLIIFPACFAYGIETTSGPSLIFITLPNVFNHMPFGRVWGSMFFLFMIFAAWSTVIAVFQNIISYTTDLSGCSVKKAIAISLPIILIGSVPCVLGFNVWSGYMPFGSGTNFMDLEDFIVSNLLLPIGSLLYVLFCTGRLGWGYDNFLKEANEGSGLKMSSAKWLRFYLRFVLPLIVLVVLATGLYAKFRG
ncbi:MAG TPA: sodium-dependent transporter [Lachnospiraceae bacterium]|nr:sodium-dependent transporter [Lachnospiraceae bacterium]